MIESNLIREELAAELTHTSVTTLTQFSEAGLIGPKLIDDNKYYDIKDLELLFHIDEKDLSQEIQSKNKLDGSWGTASKQNDKIDIDDRDSHSNQQAGTSPSLTVESSINPNTETKKLAELIERITVDPTNIDLVRKNQSLLEQLDELKEERNWLRKRLEAAENRIERDQMLLISKSETIRQLVIEKNKPSGFWSFALPLLRPFEDLRYIFSKGVISRGITSKTAEAENSEINDVTTSAEAISSYNAETLPTETEKNK